MLPRSRWLFPAEPTVWAALSGYAPLVPLPRPDAQPLVVIVPGLGLRRYLDDLATAVRGAGAQVVLLPGPGSRSVPLDVVTYAAAVAARVRSLLAASTSSRQVVLVGHSTGAQVAALAARNLGAADSPAAPGVRAPAVAPEAPWERLHLVLAGPTFDRRYRSLLHATGAFVALLSRTRLDILRLLVPDWVSAGPLRGLAAVISAWSQPLDRALQALVDHAPTVGVTVVRGERDTFASAAWCERLAARTGARVLHLAGRDHTWPYGHPEEFLRVAGLCGDAFASWQAGVG